MITISESIMAEVMACSSNDDGQDIDTTELGALNDTSRLEHYKAHLRDVCAMEIVVIFYISVVPLVYLAQEIRHSLVVELVKCRINMQLLNGMNSHQW